MDAHHETLVVSSVPDVEGLGRLVVVDVTLTRPSGRPGGCLLTRGRGDARVAPVSGHVIPEGRLDRGQEVGPVCT